MVKQNLASTAQSSKRIEEPRHGLLHATVRIHLHTIILGADIASGNPGHDHPAFHLAQKRFLGALAQQSQLKLAHRPLEPQQQTVVEQPRIVNAIVVNDQRFGHGAQIDQLMPIPVIARQAGCLQSQHRPDLALEHQIQQARKTAALDRTAAGTALILVDDGHGGKTQLPRQLGQFVLPALALQVVANLVHARLAHVNHRHALLVRALDFFSIHRGPPCPPAALRAATGRSVDDSPPLPPPAKGCAPSCWATAVRSDDWIFSSWVCWFELLESHGRETASMRRRKSRNAEKLKNGVGCQSRALQ